MKKNNNTLINNPPPPPSWISPENLRWAWWGWEPLTARHRRGGSNVLFFGDCQWSEEWHQTLFLESTIRRMRALGINLAITHFFKGFGLKAEHEAMLKARDFIKLCHKHGIKVAGYTQFRSLYYETFLNEEPKATDWIQRKSDGTLNTWGGAYYRWAPCVNSRKFISYLKKVVSYGASEIGLDGFHFDNAYALPCYCLRCKNLFRAYLKRNVKDKSRLGFLDFSNVEFPPFCDKYLDIRDPLYQEWIRFRVESLTNAWRELYAHVKSINPELCVIINPAFPRSPGWANRLSVHPYSFGRYTDLMFAENGNFPHMQDKNLVTQISAFETGQACGYRVIPTAWRHDKNGVTRCPENAQEVKLSLAEAAAFGGILGTTWALRTTGANSLVIDQPELAGALKEYIAFLDRHRDLYTGAVTEAPVGMLHSFESFAFRGDTACERFMGFEQALITAGIPYDVVFQEALDSFDRYPLIIVAGQICLSDPVLERLHVYARRGGKLVITAESGACDERNLERARNGFDKIATGTSVVRLKPLHGTEKMEEETKWIYTQVVPVPEDGAAVVKLVRKMLGAKALPYQISAPAGVVANWTRLPDGRRVLHLVNYANEKKPVKVLVRFTISALSGRKYTVCQPENNLKIDGRLNGKYSAININSLNTYAVMVVEG